MPRKRCWQGIENSYVRYISNWLCIYISEVVLRFDCYSEHQAFYGYKANLNMVFTCSVKDKPNGIIMTETRLELSLNFIT